MVLWFHLRHGGIRAIVERETGVKRCRLVEEFYCNRQVLRRITHWRRHRDQRVTFHAANTSLLPATINLSVKITRQSKIADFAPEFAV